MTNKLAAMLEKAQALPHFGRPDWAQYTVIVRTLRGKGWSYQKIFDWLISEGEPLEQTMFRKFRGAQSMLAARQQKALQRATK